MGCCCAKAVSQDVPVQNPPFLATVGTSGDYSHYRNGSNELTDALSYMHKGKIVIKMCRRRNKAHYRYFFLSHDNTRIMWRDHQIKSANENTRFVHINEIEKVMHGSDAAPHFNLKSFTLNEQIINLENRQEHCFSILHNNNLYLNLISSDAPVWIWGLQQLLQKNKRGETLSSIKSLPFNLDYSKSGTNNTVNSGNIAPQKSIDSLIKRVVAMQTRLERIKKSSLNTVLQEKHESCASQLDRLLYDLENNNESDPLLVGEIKQFKIDLWKIDVDLGAIEIQQTNTSE